MTRSNFARSLIAIALVAAAAFVMSASEPDRASTATGEPTKPAPQAADGRPHVDPEILAAVRSGAGKARVIITLADAAPVTRRGALSSAQADIATKQDSVRAALAGTDFKETHAYGVVPAISGTIDEKGVLALIQNPNVAAITLDREVQATLTEAGALINADDTHALGVTGNGVVVAVLDTGIDTDHPGLSDDLVFQKCYLSDGTCPGGGTTGNSAEDGNGHGTHVSGIITSKVVGVKGIAPDAHIAAYKILADSGSGFFSDMVLAMDDIILNHPEVDFVNMSLGAQSSYPGGSCETTNPAMTSAVATLKSLGVLTFAAAGNAGSSIGTDFPACIDNIVSVGSTYDANSGPGFCGEPTFADLVTCYSNSDPSLDLFAPGSRVTSTVNGGGTATYQGTSMASPMAAGVAALLKSDEPGLTPDQVEARLTATGVSVLDARNGVRACRVNALAAVQNTVPSPPCATSVVAPANDNRANAIPLGPQGAFQGNNSGATLEGGEPQPCGEIGATIWFVFTAPANGSVRAHTFGSGYDTVLAAYPASGGGLGANIACNDDTDGTLQSRIDFPITAGQTYYVQAGGFNGRTGFLNLVMPPPNDNFVDALSMLPPATRMQSTVGTTLEAGEPQPCGMGPTTVWYRFVAPQNGLATIDTFGSDFDTVVAAYEPSVSPPGQLGQMLGCNDQASGGSQSRILIPIIQGQTYFVQAGGWVGTTGSLQLNIIAGAGCPVPNDNQVNAESIATFTTYEACNIGATLEPGEVGYCGVNSTLWYRYDATEDGLLVVSTSGSDFDTVLAAYEVATSPPGQLNFTTCNNDESLGNPSSEIVFVVKPGRTYYVQAGGLNDAAGQMQLNAYLQGPCDISNNNVASAQAMLAGQSMYACNFEATNQANEPQPCGIIGSTVWFKLSSAKTGTMTVNTYASGLDTVLASYAGLAPPSGGATPITCNDDVGGFRHSEISFAVQAGVTYFLQVGGYSGQQGFFYVNPTCDFDVDCDNVLVNDNCSMFNPDQINNDNGPWITPGRPNDVTIPWGDDGNAPYGDACDWDDDNDHLMDIDEPLPISPPAWLRNDCPLGVGSLVQTNPDTDGDRVLDRAECVLGSNPNSASSKPADPPAVDDPDNDNLPTSLENTIGSNPNDRDSDDDGILDGVEYMGYGTDLTRTDSDRDQCLDDKEIASVDGNTAVNSTDLLIIALQFGNTTQKVPDINRDGIVNSGDLGLAASRLGLSPVTVCQAAPPSPPAF